MVFGGVIEADEAYFYRKPPWITGRGTAGKVAVFGLLERGGRVYAQVVPDVKGTTLLPIIQRKVRPGSVIYTDEFGAYQGLESLGFRHHCINHSRDFAKGKIHTNGIENFWRQTKRRLWRYNGIPKENFELYLAEAVWRFNAADTKA